MATATAKTETKTTGVTLELTLQEATTLRQYLNLCAGPLGNVYDALRKAIPGAEFVRPPLREWPLRVYAENIYNAL